MCCILVVTILYGLRLQNPINYSLSGQTVDKVPHSCAGFFFAKYQNVQCLCGLLGDFLV